MNKKLFRGREVGSQTPDFKEYFGSLQSSDALSGPTAAEALKDYRVLIDAQVRGMALGL